MGSSRRIGTISICLIFAAWLLVLPARATLADVVALNNDGVRALNSGNYPLAISKFEAACARDPNYKLAKENLAIAYNNYGLTLQNNPREAIKQFHKAAYLDPGNATTLNNLNGIISFMQKSPNSFKDRVVLGDQARVSGDFIGAVVEYTQALKLKDDPDIHGKLGDVYRVRNQNDDAIAQYQAAAAIADSSDIQVKLGQAYQAKKDVPDAILAYGNALKLKPDDPDVLAALIAGWDEALRENPSAPENHIGMGQALQYRGDFDQAAAEYKTALMYDPNNQIAKKLLQGLGEARRTAAITKHVDAGVDLQSRKLYDQAVDEYQIALRADPRNSAIMVNIGSAYQQKGDFNNAIAYYQKALSVEPSNSAAQQGLKASQDGRQAQLVADTAKQAADLFKMGRYDESIAKYRQLLQSNPSDPETHFNLAATYQAKKDFDGAIVEYRQAIALDPNNPDYKSDLSECTAEKAKPLVDQAVQAQKGGDYATAIDLYNQALTLIPNNAGVWYNLAATYYAREDYTNARNAYGKALMLDPGGQVDDIYLQALIDEHYGKGSQALNEYHDYLSKAPSGQYAQQATARMKALIANPNDTIKIKPQAEIAREKEAADDYQQAAQLQQQRRYDEAMALYQKAINLQPGESAYVYGMGTVFQQKGDLDQAIRWYQQAIALDPKNADYPRTLQSAYEQKAGPLVDQAVKLQTAGNYQGAIDLYNQAVQLLPKNARLWTNLGAAYQNSDMFSQARDAYRQGLDLDPKGEAANYYYIAAIDENANQGARALSGYQKYVSSLPGGQYTQAAQDRIRALSANPSNVKKLQTQAEVASARDAQAAYDQGVKLQQANDFDNAIAQYQKAAALVPKEPDYVYAIGTAYQAKGDIDSAISFYHQACNLDSNKPQYRQALSAAYDLKFAPIMDEAIKRQGAGDFAGAIAAYQKALAIEPQNARGFTNLASAYQSADDFASARLNFQKALDLDPKGEAENWYFLGVLDENSGQGMRAAQDYRKYLAAQPRGNYVGLAQARVRALSINPNDTQKMVSQAEQKKSGEAESAYQQAVQLQQADKLNEAIAQYKSALALMPDEASYWYSLGTAYQANNAIDSALDAYGKANRLNPGEKSYKDLINQLKLAKAAPLIDSAVKKQTTKTTAGGYDLAGAIADYEAALRIAPDDATTHLNLGTAYQGNNNFPRAVAEYNRALALDPKQTDAHYYLATVYEAMKQPGLALSEYRKYIAMAPAGPNAGESRRRIKALGGR